VPGHGIGFRINYHPQSDSWARIARNYEAVKVSFTDQPDQMQKTGAPCAKQNRRRYQRRRKALLGINPKEAQLPLVSGRSFHVIDDEDFDWTFAGRELQPELLLNGGKDRRAGRAWSRRSRANAVGSVESKLRGCRGVENVFQMNIEHSGKVSVVSYGAVKICEHPMGKLIHGYSQSVSGDG
jgi:hypothetical protein